VFEISETPPAALEGKEAEGRIKFSAKSSNFLNVVLAEAGVKVFKKEINGVSL
jgi:hypothetical protein